jgi:hypothetical protein
VQTLVDRTKMKLTVLSCLLTFSAAELTSVSTDFEEGSMSPWNTSGNSWNIQSFHLSSVAKPPSGDKYLVTGRNLEVDSGTADLQSPVFTALPGHFVQFSCWVQAKQNNLQLLFSFYSFNFIHFNSLFKSADFSPRRDGRHSLRVPVHDFKLRVARCFHSSAHQSPHQRFGMQIEPTHIQLI